MTNFGIYELFSFFDRGGIVLYIVFTIAIFLWMFLIEKFIYLNFFYEKDKNSLLESIKLKNIEKRFVQDVKNYLVEDLDLKLKFGLPFIKTLIIVCPLVGLLGTVTGMIEVFDVMSINGTSNVKSMANGVSMATIPTMAGMVVALSGILFEKKLELSIKFRKQKFDLELIKVMK
jgi:biopolymer transport protein ExbB